MTKLLPLILCLCLSLDLYSRTHDHGPGDICPLSYLDYYHAIAAAEEAVVAGSYAHAVAQYQAVFKEYPYNNPIDCYIAAQIASYIDDTASCVRFLHKGLCFGLPVQTITGNPHLKDRFLKLDGHTVDSCLSVYRGRIDQPARERMLSLIRYDQAVIHHMSDGSIYDYRSAGRALKSRYQPIWDSLIKELISLIRTSGFPAQKIIGTQHEDDSLFRVGPNSVFAFYIFVHHTKAWPLVGDLLWTELQKGNITPQMYGVIYEHSNGKMEMDNPVHYFASRPCWERWCRRLIKDQLPVINEARRSIGLGSYEVMEQKAESGKLYLKWLNKGPAVKKPFFDFQTELNFQGRVLP